MAVDVYIDAEESTDAVEAAPNLRAMRKDVDDEMDITPMIDITFLLLIFFLVASTPDKQTAIELPEANSGSAVSQLTSIVFTVGDGGLDAAPWYHADGKIEELRIEGEDLAKRKAKVKEIVELEFQTEQKTDAVIKGDKSVKARDIGDIIKAISQVEGIKIHLAILETQ